MTSLDPESLEFRLAYLERTSQELGDVIYRQQREIEVLRERLAACERSLASRDGVAAPGDAGDERPPHY
jgi:SlyX protein